MALPDPYDDLANVPFRLYDMSYYRGRYYMYFGPMPALIIMACRCLGANVQTDNCVSLICGFFLMVFYTLALRAGCARLFPGRSMALATLAGLSLGLLAPTTCCLGGHSFYEAPTVSGPCFLCLSLWLLWSAPTQTGPLRWALMGASQVCSLASRVALLPGLACVAALTGWLRGRRAWMLALSWILGLTALGWYNQARFGDPREVGFRYQLSQVRNDGPQIVSLLHVPANLYVHLLQPPQMTSHFPFVHVVERPLPECIPHTSVYVAAQPVVGLVWSTPLIFFLPASLWALWRCRGRDLITGSLCLTLLSGVASLSIWNPALRYQMDFAPALLALSVVGVYQLAGRWPRAVYSSAALACVYSMLVGVLMGVSLTTESFEENQPNFYGTLKQCFPAPPLRKEQ